MLSLCYTPVWQVVPRKNETDIFLLKPEKVPISSLYDGDENAPSGVTTELEQILSMSMSAKAKAKAATSASTSEEGSGTSGSGTDVNDEDVGLDPSEPFVCEDIKFIVRRVHGMAPADYSVVAYEQGQTKPVFETLLPDVPAEFVFPGRTQSFSTYVNSAVTQQKLRLQCTPSCDGVQLSASMAPEALDHSPGGVEGEGNDDRRGRRDSEDSDVASSSGEESSQEESTIWSKTGSSASTLIELKLNDKAFTRGSTIYPRIIYVWVLAPELPNAGQLTRCSVTATRDSKFTLLLDGSEAVIGIVKPNIPLYLAFDAPRPTSLLTLIAKIPFDAEDDPYNRKIRLYAQHCVHPDQMVGEDVKDLPGPENFRYVARINSRNQLETFVDNV